MFKNGVLPSIALLLALVWTTAVSAQVGPSENPQLNINLATAEELAAHLEGVGAARAQAIIRHREEYGDFKLVEDLVLVDGIGPAILETNRTRIRVE